MGVIRAARPLNTTVHSPGRLDISPTHLTTFVIATTRVIVDPNDELNTIGKRLRFARLHRGIGSRELARKAELGSESHTSRIEGGRENVDVGIVAALAKALDVSLDWLVQGGDIPETLKGAAPEGDTAFQHQTSPTGTGEVR